MSLLSLQTILLVEDDPDDLFLFQRAFERVASLDTLRVVRNGEEVMKMFAPLVDEIQGENEAEEYLSRFPSLIVLDLKMPRKSGMEVLSWLRNQPILRRIPIVVMSSSKAAHDINEAYDCGANSYIVKPLEFQELSTILKSLTSYWLETITPPGYH